MKTLDERENIVDPATDQESVDRDNQIYLEEMTGLLRQIIDKLSNLRTVTTTVERKKLEDI